MPKYNGHKNWNHWNVSLWIGNEEDTYNRVKFWLKKKHLSKDAIASILIREFQNRWGTTTPDGAPITFSAVRAYLSGMVREDY